MLPGDARDAACADRLDLVDAAYEKPGGPQAKVLKNDYCRLCPMAEACLTAAMAHGERGVWGGTTPGVRTRAGSAGYARQYSSAVRARSRRSVNARS